MNATYTENETVIVTNSFTSADGCGIDKGDVGTLMTDMGDGDWLVYIPGKGSPLMNECNFAAE